MKNTLLLLVGTTFVLMSSIYSILTFKRKERKFTKTFNSLQEVQYEFYE